jgi:hypothetical protein
VITFTLAVGTIWFVFAYVVYLVYRIKKSTVKLISSQQKNNNEKK